MKTKLIRIDRSEKGTYYIGFGIGFEIELPLYPNPQQQHSWFAGLIIQFFSWTIRIGIDREME